MECRLIESGLVELHNWCLCASITNMPLQYQFPEYSLQFLRVVSCFQGLKEEVPISQKVDHFTRAASPAALGDGAGILIAAESIEGCILGAAAPGQRGVLAEDIGTRAATELLEDLSHGACVDRW